MSDRDYRKKSQKLTTFMAIKWMKRMSQETWASSEVGKTKKKRIDCFLELPEREKALPTP